MKRLRRRDAVSPASGRRPDEAAFQRARLHLTAWYVLTLAAIVIVFSIALYAALAAQLSQHQQEGPDPVPDRQVERETADFALGRLRILLAAGNVVFLAGAAGGAYLLAGKTLQPIAAALERQRRFTADASHELRTPLTVMRGTLDVALQRERTAAAYREVLCELGEEVDAMTKLSEQLLHLARGGPRPLTATAGCDLRAILEDVLQSTSELVGARGDTVRFTAPESLVAAADPVEMRQVFLNLVMNALQHTPPHTSVCLMGSRHDRALEVVVSDNGPGIPADERAGVFQPFYRLHTTSAEGTGLGLALCHELVAANGGSISVEETTGGGATFRVWLPAIE